MATSPWLVRGPRVGRILRPSDDILGYPILQDFRGRLDFFMKSGSFLHEHARSDAGSERRETTEETAAKKVAIGKEAIPRRYLRYGWMEVQIRRSRAGTGQAFRGELSALSTTSRADMDRTRKKASTGQDRFVANPTNLTVALFHVSLDAGRACGVRECPLHRHRGEPLYRSWRTLFTDGGRSRRSSGRLGLEPDEGFDARDRIGVRGACRIRRPRSRRRLIELSRPSRRAVSTASPVGVRAAGEWAGASIGAAASNRWQRRRPRAVRTRRRTRLAPSRSAGAILRGC